MVEIINGVAYLNGITDPKQSKDMFGWLKENTNQELYLIKGKNSYGCDINGNLVHIANMPANKVKDGFCISDWYVPQVNSEPVIDNITAGLFNSSILSNEKELKPVGIKESPTQEDNSKEELINANATIKTLEDDVLKLSDKIICLEMANAKLLEERNVEKQRAKDAEDKLDEFISECEITDAIDKNDVRGLCKALYDLGFIVKISYNDKSLIEPS